MLTFAKLRELVETKFQSPLSLLRYSAASPFLWDRIAAPIKRRWRPIIVVNIAIDTKAFLLLVRFLDVFFYNYVPSNLVLKSVLSHWNQLVCIMHRGSDVVHRIGIMITDTHIEEILWWQLFSNTTPKGGKLGPRLSQHCQVNQQIQAFQVPITTDRSVYCLLWLYIYVVLVQLQPWKDQLCQTNHDVF